MAGNMFERFDQYLNKAFSDNYWSDEGISICADMVESFEAQDWEALRHALHIRSHRWSMRCAEVLGEAPANLALPALLELAQSGNGDVLEAALDSLNTLSDSDQDLLRPHRSTLRPLIEATLQNAGPASKAMLRALLDTLGQDGPPE